MNAPAINVGASVEAIAEAREAILAILQVNVADQVKIDALTTLRVLCEVKYTTIANNVFHGEPEK